MQVEARYLPPHRREGGTLENIAKEKPNELEPQPLKGFLLKLTPLHNLEHMKGAFLLTEAWGASCSCLQESMET